VTRGLWPVFAGRGPSAAESKFLSLTEPPPGQERLAAADASHAWFTVYVPQLGRVDFDPTNDQVPGDRRITTAHRGDYSDVTLLKGVLYGGGQPARP